MDRNRPKTKDEIIRDEKLQAALQKWLNGTTMESLDEYHKNNFGKDFNPNNKDTQDEDFDR